MFLFFFFKQKTAYEMRISDWSSDVCSSDLPAGRSALMMGGESGRDPNEEDSRLESLKERLRQADQDEGDQFGQQFDARLAQGDEAIGRQIGRASCRERVCQYV